MKLAMSQQESMALLGTYAKAIGEAERLKVQLEAAQEQVRKLEKDLSTKSRDLEDQKYYRERADSSCENYRGQLQALEKAQQLTQAQYKLSGEQISIFDAKMKEEFCKHLPELCRHMVKGEKIQAIKLVRSLTSMGLKEAKDTVDGNYYPTLGNLIREKLAVKAATGVYPASPVSEEDKFPTYDPSPYNPYHR